MCSNIVLDYMDDLVESLEGFIQKSLLAIIVALSVIVASVVYLLKVLSERSLESSFGTQEARIDGRNFQNTISRDGRVKPRRRDVNEDVLVVQDDKMKVSAAAMAHSIPSYDESVLRLVGLSCCTKPSCKSKSKIQATEFDRVSKSSDVNMAPIVIKQEVEDEKQKSRSPIPNMPQDIKLEKPSRSNSRSPLRSPSPKHSTPSLTICPKASSRKSCCSMCCKDEKQL